MDKKERDYIKGKVSICVISSLFLVIGIINFVREINRFSDGFTSNMLGLIMTIAFAIMMYRGVKIVKYFFIMCVVMAAIGFISLLLSFDMIFINSTNFFNFLNCSIYVLSGIIMLFTNKYIKIYHEYKKNNSESPVWKKLKNTAIYQRFHQ